MAPPDNPRIVRTLTSEALRRPSTTTGGAFVAYAGFVRRRPARLDAKRLQQSGAAWSWSAGAVGPDFAAWR
jgi:hypothetical protein